MALETMTPCASASGIGKSLRASVQILGLVSSEDGHLVVVLLRFVCPDLRAVRELGSYRFSAVSMRCRSLKVAHSKI